jgi:3-dehydroquinate dehydratase/shikimate dehydrogenase
MDVWMALLVTSVMADTLHKVEARAENAWAGGTEAVELRIDTYQDDPTALAKYLTTHKDRVWIVTCRSAAEGGRSTADTTERVELLMAAVHSTGAYIDFELADWRSSGPIQQELQPASQPMEGKGRRLILSTHDFSDAPSDCSAIVDAVTATRTGAIAKVAYRAGDICDSFAALDLIHDRGNGVIAVAMGEPGLWSRVLAKKFGAFATYCRPTTEAATAPGQPTLADMVDRFRWRDIDTSTRVFGVLGDPIAHSMGPLLFNRWFADADVNAVYLPLCVAAEKGCLERFLSGCMDRPWLDIGGFSVTIPHKAAALKWVGKGADRLSTSIGAINTLTFRGDRIIGHNTDCGAAVDSLTDALGCTPSDLPGLPVDVLGTGGAARAVLAGLREHGCVSTVYGRSRDRTEEIAEAFAATPAVWEERAGRTGELLINCTSVGMWPEVDDSPMPDESLCGCRLVFDLVYNPLETRLLKDAAAAGAKTLNGLDMFIRQAAGQFELWTSQTPDTHLARELIAREILQTASMHR